MFLQVPTAPSTSWAFSKYFLVTGDASYSDLGGLPAILIVSQPHGEQVQGMRHELLPQRSGGLPGVACGQDLGSELETLEFQPSSATVSLCNPEQLTNTL